MLSKVKYRFLRALWSLVLHNKALRAALRLSTSSKFRTGKAHELPNSLVVSLTSYPKRYSTLDLTIKSLLDQEVKPNLIVLWVTDKDLLQLPDKILRLQSDIFCVKECFRDIKSYKKIVPALELYPSATIVTADDDVYYPPSWLGSLVTISQSSSDAIVCWRAHSPRYHEDGRLKPYKEWEWNTALTNAGAGTLFPTGVGGVLYPPGSLSPKVADIDTFMSLAPHADDVWLFFMGHLAGSDYRRVDGDFHLLTWPGSQSSSLMQQNVGKDENDLQIQALEKHFGTIFTLADRID